MNLRMFLLLMALLLVWSGHTVDRPVGASASIAVTHHAVGSEGDVSSGAQTTQAVEEGVVDLVGLLPTDADAPSTLLLMSWPGRYATRARIAPYLDGPQRPPRATHLA